MQVEPHPGLVLSGRYQLERELGRGGMGSVWLATHTTLESRVAVKVLSTSVNVKDAESRFLFEARSAARLNNPHVVHLSDFGVHDGKPFLVMELLEGETLAARLAREGKLSPPMTARILAQVCHGVAAAHHASIVHRDLKPENVFLIDNGHDLLVKVLDFGVAKALRQGAYSPSTETGTTIGTLPYMAPEQIVDSKRVGIAADIWSLGVIAFECLLGQLPFDAQNAGALVYAICHQPPPIPSSVGQVPQGFDAWFARATAAKPEERWTTVADAAQELSRVCGVPSSQAAPTPKTLPTHNALTPEAALGHTGEPVWSNAHRQKAWRWPWVVVGLVLVAMGLGVWLTRPDDDNTPSVTSTDDETAPRIAASNDTVPSVAAPLHDKSEPSLAASSNPAKNVPLPAPGAPSSSSPTQHQAAHVEATSGASDKSQLDPAKNTSPAQSQASPPSTPPPSVEHHGAAPRPRPAKPTPTRSPARRKPATKAPTGASPKPHGQDEPPLFL